MYWAERRLPAALSPLINNVKAEGFASLSSGRQTKHGIVVPFGARTANAGQSRRFRQFEQRTSNEARHSRAVWCANSECWQHTTITTTFVLYVLIV
jgi:hypothetical protein